MKITEDNFVWKIVTNIAKPIFNSNLFELYVLHADDTEALIETSEELNRVIDMGCEIGIEVGQIMKHIN